MLLLADSAPARAGRVLLARPTVYLPDLLMILQEPVGGVPLDLLIGRMDGAATAGDPRGWEGIVRAAPALAAVHTAGLVAGRERPIAAELKRFGKRAARIAEVDPELGARLLALADALRAESVHLPAWGAELKPDSWRLQAQPVPDRAGWCRDLRFRPLRDVRPGQ